MRQVIPLVRSSTLLGFVNFLEQLGSPVDRLLQEFCIPKDYVFDLNAFCAEAQLFGFIEKAAKLEEIKYLGKLVAEKSDLMDLGIFGSLVLQSTTVRDCLNSFVRFFVMHHSDGSRRYWWHQKGEEVFFVCNNTPYRYWVAGSTHAMDYSIIFMLKVLRAYLGTTWQPSRVHFRGSYAEEWEGCDLLTNVELYFDCNYGVIVFPSALLDVVRPSKIVPLPSDDLAIWLSSQASDRFADSLKLVMRSLMSKQVVKLKDVSNIIEMSPRTIQRQLLKEKTSYSQVLAEIRYEIAIQQVAHSSLPFKEIASELGYTSSAHFTRTFKEWTGKNPTQFRNQLHKNLQAVCRKQ